MPDIVHRSLSGGEVAPALYGRADVVKYQTGLRICRNFIVRRHGGIENRPGTGLVGIARFPSTRGRILKFVFNPTQTYVLWFEPFTLRIAKNGALLTVSPSAWVNPSISITGATKANPCVITATAHGLTDGTSIWISGVVGMTELNGKAYIVANATTNNFELLGVDSTSYSTYTSGGTISRYYLVGELASRLSVNYYCILAHFGQQPPNATYWYPMPADGTLEIPTPYTEASLPTLYRSQSADVITLTSTSFGIRDLSRLGETWWTLTSVSMAPTISAPATLTNDKVAGTLTQWVATAVKAETYEESLPSPSTGATTAPTAGTPITLTIGAVSGAVEYNVYRNEGSGIYGFIGVSSGPTFKDYGLAADYNTTPPTSRDPFTSSFPACSGYIQQRKFYGGVPAAPETAYGSRTGRYKNFTVSLPLQDDDAVTYPIASQEVNAIRHILEVLESFILTSGAEWVAMGDGGSGALTPSTPWLKPRSYYGSSEVQPVLIGDNIVYVQARGGQVRDLNYDVSAKGYSGRDLSVFATHLFTKKTIEHMDFAQIPNSVVWVTQNDGSLLGLTYLREHEVWGWHRHDTDGQFEDVCCVPEGTEDATYVLVKRTINGTTQRYLERFASRVVSDVTTESRFMDAFLSYDGRNTDGVLTITLSGGTTWVYTETLTMTSSGPVFNSNDVGNAIRLAITSTTWTPENNSVTTTEYLICTITTYTSSTQVSVRAEKDVPVAFRNLTTSNWAKGVDEFAGMGHLEGKALSIIADGNVVTNGIDAPLTTVAGGTFTLAKPAFVVHAGLPYCSDMETLDLEVLDGETLTARQKSVNQVLVKVEASRGMWLGNTARALFEHKQRSTEPYGTPLPLITGEIVVNCTATWNKGGRVFIRQRDPLPLSILSITPNVEIGG